MAILVGIARQRGVAGYVGDGGNRWPAVHRSDAARLARLAVESAPAGSVLHAVGDEGVPFREIAGAMGLVSPSTSTGANITPTDRELRHPVKGVASFRRSTVTPCGTGWLLVQKP
jgi:nucleoside-diphosphate-sugar epimerase